MLHFGLVLLFATSAFAAPSTAEITTVPINEYKFPRGNGSPINSRVIDQVYSIIDGGEVSIYTTAAINVIKDVADIGDAYTQSLAAAEIIAIIGEYIPGTAGDSCDAAALVNAAASGNRALIRSALVRYITRLNYNIDNIVQLNSGDEAVKYETGLKGNCAYAGRTYNFDAVWNALLNRVKPYELELINELYCNARRLYNGLIDRNNYVGAAVTAASTKAVVDVFQQSLAPVTRFLQVVANGGDARSAGQAAKAALSSAAARY